MDASQMRATEKTFCPASELLLKKKGSRNLSKRAGYKYNSFSFDFRCFLFPSAVL